MLFFLLSSGGALSFRKELLPYSLAYGMVYCMSLFGGTNSVCRGSLSISMLILQCSLIIPALFGIVFFKERISSFGYVGIILLFVSLFLVNTKNEQMKISRSWVFWTIIGFIGNGMCSPVQKMQQLRFEELYKNEFMVLASLFVTVVAFIAGIYKNKKVKQDFVSCVLRTGSGNCKRFGQLTGDDFNWDFADCDFVSVGFCRGDGCDLYCFVACISGKII